jgi:hypothetical protein
MNPGYPADQEKDFYKKYKDIDKLGVNSKHWTEVLEVIKFLETKEEYEKCQELWEYYNSVD